MNAKIPDIVSDLVGSDHQLQTVLADHGLAYDDLTEADRAEINALARKCAFCGWWHPPAQLRQPYTPNAPYTICEECFNSWVDEYF